MNEIHEDKIIAKKWWHQLGIDGSITGGVVPGMMFINSKNRTCFGGKSFEQNTRMDQNLHELACVSGIAAAWRFGADYIKFNDFAEDFFSKYLMVLHGVRYRAEESKKSKRK